MVSKIVREMVNKNIDKDCFNNFANTDDHEIIQRLLVKAIIALRISMKKLETIIESAEDKWILYEILMQVKHNFHQQIDVLMKEKRKYKKRSYALATIR